MGIFFTKPDNPNPSVTKTGSFVGDWKTGFRYGTAEIKSGPGVIKKPMGGLGIASGAQVWGPYKKEYTKNMFGQLMFYPPQKVDDVPILTQCRHIKDFVRTDEGKRYITASGALLVGSKRPACWRGTEETMFNSEKGDNYEIVVGHPEFYAYAASKQGMAGLATDFLGINTLLYGKGKGKGKGKKKTRKTRRRNTNRL
jgi:hypothetical protein